MKHLFSILLLSTAMQAQIIAVTKFALPDAPSQQRSFWTLRNKVNVSILAGLVTAEDILEELVGKIRAEVETESFVMEKLDAGRWRVSGTMRLDDFRREYPPLGDVGEVETMGGLLTSLMDVVPGPGESATFRGLKLTAHVTDERRVREVLVEAIK